MRREESNHSWIKHGLTEAAVVAQVIAYRVAHPSHKILLMDGNAGPGRGVPIDHGKTISRSSPEILTQLANQVGNADVVLCEKDYKKRSSLCRSFRTVHIVEHHRDVLAMIQPEHRYGVWISDPCGYGPGHGIEYMVDIAKRLPTDFIIIFNEHALSRVRGTCDDDAWSTTRGLYLERLDPQWWRRALGKAYLARTHKIDASPNFRFRVMVAADHLAESCGRFPFKEIFTDESAPLGGTLSRAASA
jgi:hypothetical protein